VTAHRMALAISATQTVLWDQVQYAGSPQDFAWVLPVRQGAYLEVSNDAWFETLDAATTVRINAPTLDCGSGSSGAPIGCGMPMGCSSDEAPSGSRMGGLQKPKPDPVTVVHEGSAGPYETVTLHSNIAGALNQWLAAHQYAIGVDI